jgi:hypothetical protein
VTVDAKLKTLSFPAIVNMTMGLVEYAVVTSGGKVHESVFKTEAEPAHIHAAMLLLGAKVDTNLETAVFFDPQRQIPGPKLKIEVASVATDNANKPIDAFLRNAQEGARENHVPFWIYNGSRFSGGVFLAQREGSIVSLIADPAALINNPRRDRENDELWSVKTTALPPVETAVEIRMTLTDDQATSNAQ